MTELIINAEPPAEAVGKAILASRMSPCRSKRGAVVFKGDVVFTLGCNHQAAPFECDGSLNCKTTCRTTAVHAEQAALSVCELRAHGCELLHVKTVDGELVPSGPPSCVECSKLAVAFGIAGVWLYHSGGWMRYEAHEFHRCSMAAATVLARAQSDGAALITAERRRQVEREGWTPEHDDEHTDGSLALAACCYAAPERLFVRDQSATSIHFSDPWPGSWARSYDKRLSYGERRRNPGNYPAPPSSYTREERIDLLVKAGALVAAEIDRLKRQVKRR